MCPPVWHFAMSGSNLSPKSLKTADLAFTIQLVPKLQISNYIQEVKFGQGGVWESSCHRPIMSNPSHSSYPLKTALAFSLVCGAERTRDREGSYTVNAYNHLLPHTTYWWLLL